MAGLWVGEPRLAVHEKRGAGLLGTSCGVAAGARGHAMCREGRNESNTLPTH